MPNIVIVGGGVAGVKVATALEKHSPSLPADYRIVLVDKREFYYHMIAGLRASLEAPVADQSLIPYDRLFQGSKTARVTKAEVTKFDDSFIYTNATGADAKLDYAYLILATGCDWSDDIDVPASRDEALKKFVSQGEKIAASKKIVVVGGGAVGTELAGEIAEKYSGQKLKDVTLVHRGRLLMNDNYPDKMRKNLQSQLEGLGVTVKLGASIEGDAIAGELALSNGERLTCDLLLKTLGGRPNSALVKAFDSAAVSANSSVKVNEYLQVVGHPKIFAMGDLADLKEQKQAAKIDGHVSVVAMNVVSMIKENKAAKAYSGPKELIIVTVGKKGGAGYMFGFNVGSWVSSMIKSKGLFISQTRKTLAY